MSTGVSCVMTSAAAASSSERPRGKVATSTCFPRSFTALTASTRSPSPLTSTCYVVEVLRRPGEHVDSDSHVNTLLLVALPDIVARPARRLA